MAMIRYFFHLKMPQLVQPPKAGNLNCWDLVLSIIIKHCNNIMNSYDDTDTDTDTNISLF